MGADLATPILCSTSQRGGVIRDVEADTPVRVVTDVLRVSHQPRADHAVVDAGKVLDFDQLSHQRRLGGKGRQDTGQERDHRDAFRCA